MHVSLEKEIIGNLVHYGREAMALAINIITKDDFIDHTYSKSFELMDKLFRQNKDWDLSIIACRFSEHEMGGASILADSYTNCIPSLTIFKHKIVELRKHTLESHLRSDIKMNSDINKLKKTIGELLKLEISQEQGIASQKAIQNALSDLETYVNAGIELPTGWGKFDNALGGLHKKDLVVIGGRTSHGKTNLALNMALNLIKQKKHVLIVNGEMSTNQLIYRMLCMNGDIDNSKIRNRSLSESDWLKLRDSGSELYNYNFNFYCKGSITTSKIRELTKKYNPDVVIVDYIQMLTDSQGKESRAQHVSNIARELKNIAMDENTCILGLAQLSRSVEQRSDRGRVPILADLKECVDKDTLIFNCNNGKRFTIEEYYNSGIIPKILTLDSKSNILSSRYPKQIINTGKKPSFKIKTKSGKEIILSDNSLLYTPNGWRYVKELNVHDKIAVSEKYYDKKMPVKGQYPHLFKKGSIPHNKGKKGLYKVSEKTRNLLSKKLTGLKRSEKFKQKMRSINPPLGIKEKSNKGYILEYEPNHPRSGKDGYVPQHRLVLEKHLNRYLDIKEIVHHLDGNKQNNKLENLLLTESVQKHNVIHRKMEHFVQELIKKGEVVYDDKRQEFRYTK